MKWYYIVNGVTYERRGSYGAEMRLILYPNRHVEVLVDVERMIVWMEEDRICIAIREDLLE